jgi:hypothetical protein
MRIAHLGASALALTMLAGCTAAQIQTASADFQTACQDWNAAKLIAAPFASVPLVGTVEAYVSDACDNEAFISAATVETVTWLQTATKNLKAVTPPK